MTDLVRECIMDQYDLSIQIIHMCHPQQMMDSSCAAELFTSIIRGQPSVCASVCTVVVRVDEYEWKWVNMVFGVGKVCTYSTTRTVVCLRTKGYILETPRRKPAWITVVDPYNNLGRRSTAEVRGGWMVRVDDQIPMVANFYSTIIILENSPPFFFLSYSSQFCFFIQ